MSRHGLDSGKAITDCLHKIGTEVANIFQWFGELTDKSFGKVAPTGEDALALIVKEPAGVVGLVLPWNFPLLMASWNLAPALAAGRSCIVKPAEQTPLTTFRLAELAQESGVPDGVLNVLPGLSETTGQAQAVTMTMTMTMTMTLISFRSQAQLKLAATSSDMSARAISWSLAFKCAVRARSLFSTMLI